jgi:metal-responsive CopG/Arc/MetJ family transcriptional regulator
MVKRENRISVALPNNLLKYVDDEVTRRGLNPNKRSLILLEALSEKYERSKLSHSVEEPGLQYLPSNIVETLSDQVMARALEKIEVRVRKK